MQRQVNILSGAVVVRSQDIVIIEGSQIKAFPSSRHPINNDSSLATSEIMGVVVPLLASYQKVHQVIQLGFSLVLLLLKIMGEFGVLVGCALLSKAGKGLPICVANNTQSCTTVLSSHFLLY